MGRCLYFVRVNKKDALPDLLSIDGKVIASNLATIAL